MIFYSSFFNGVWYYSTQILIDTVYNSSGAIDSIKSTVINVNQPSFTSIFPVTCGSYTSATGKVFTSSGIYKDTLLNAAICDSIITYNLTINSPTASTYVKSACGSYTWSNGVTYTSNNNTAKDTLVNSAGCDSIITLNLTITSNSSSTHTHTTCDSYTWRGTTYTASNNTATDTLMNAAGCDSIIHLNLTINNTVNTTDTHSACGSFTWKGTTYTSSNNTAKDTMMSSSGCDSIITLNLTIGAPNSGVNVVNACGSYTWNGIIYTSSNNTAKDTLTNSSGCDSIVTLNLTILPAPDVSVIQTMDTLKSNQSGAAYQWIDCGNGNAAVSGATSQQFVPLTSGSFAAIVTLGSCTDTTGCKIVAKSGISESFNSNLVSVFPNPTHGEFVISFKENQTNAYKVVISNSVGQVVKQFESTRTNQDVDLKAFSNGIYFITISNATESATLRIVKQ